MSSGLPSRRRALVGVGAALLAAAVIAGGWWAISASNAESAHWARAQRRAFAKANTICGGPPRSIKPHGSSWNFGPWLQVICRDGTQRAVQP